MKDYMIFLLSGKVVDIASFDEEESRDVTLKLCTDNMFMYNHYNEIQTLNEVC